MSRHLAARRHDLRVLVALVAVLAIVFSVTGVAHAYFRSTGSDTATGTAGTLNPPTDVTGSQVTGTSTVSVSWTAPVAGAVPTGYYVLRAPSSGPAVPACGTSAAAPTVSTSCSDTSVPVGSYTYTVVAVHQSWTAASAPSATVTVVATTQAITFTSSPVAPTFGGTYTVTATGGASGNPVVFSAATPGVCTVTSGGSVSFVHAGSCTINANQAGNAQYDPAPQVQQTFTVAKASQTITYTSTAPTTAVVGGPGYTPTATGGASGNPVTFTIDASTAANCSISGGVVTPLHVGSCTINANQAGGADHLAASQVQQSYAIGQGSQAITFTSTAPANAKVNGTYTVTATGGGSGNAVVFSAATPAVCTVTSGGSVAFIAAGTCTINANQAGNADYLAAAQVQQTFAVTKNDQTITFTSTPPSAATYQGATYTVAATATSGLAVAFTIDTSTNNVCTRSGSTISFIGVGTCTINASQAGNTAYNAAPIVQQSFSVGKAAQTITFGTITDKTFGNGPFALTATASSGLAVTYASITPAVCTVSGITVTMVGAGTCTINADQTGDANYNAAAQVQQSFTVNRAAQTITFAQPTTPATATTSVSFTATSTSGLTVTVTPTDATVCSVTGSTINYLKAGTCTLTASQAGNTNYAPATNVVRTVTVNLAAQTITFNQPTTPANAGTTATLVATSTSGLTVAFTTPSAATICTISGTTVTYVGAGSCVINANQAGDAVYAAATQVQRTVTVQAADTVAPTISNIMNGRNPLSWTNNNNGSSSWNGAACAGNQLCATITDAGSPTSGVDPSTITFSLVRATGTSPGQCYDSTAGDFKASPCAITVTFSGGVARATVDQADMTDGTYTFTINAKDFAGNAAVQQVVTLTIT